jgi:hypothetical protein
LTLKEKNDIIIIEKKGVNKKMKLLILGILTFQLIAGLFLFLKMGSLIL